MVIRLARPEDAEELFLLNKLFGNTAAMEAIKKSLKEKL
jgi:hypothetical protein